MFEHAWACLNMKRNLGVGHIFIHCLDPFYDPKRIAKVAKHTHPWKFQKRQTHWIYIYIIHIYIYIWYWNFWYLKLHSLEISRWNCSSSLEFHPERTLAREIDLHYGCMKTDLGMGDKSQGSPHEISWNLWTFDFPWINSPFVNHTTTQPQNPENYAKNHAESNCTMCKLTSPLRPK